MDFLEFKTGQDDQDRRLDKVIRIFIPELTLSQVYQSLRKGLIKVNQKKAKADYRIQAGDIIYAAKFLIGEEGKKEKEPLHSVKEKHFDISIIFENEDILILNKPAGINIHPAKAGDYALTDFVLEHYKAGHNKDSLSFKPGPLHRLDKMTGGLVCFSMSSKGARWFTQNMKNHQIKKTYIALVQGQFKNEESWQDRLEKKEDTTGNSAFHTVKISESQGKIAITRAIPLKNGLYKGQKISLVEYQIQTGRQHQIRAQSAEHGFPLWGDTAYGADKNEANSGKYTLFAYKLEFPQNELGIPCKIELDFPQRIKDIFNL